MRQITHIVIHCSATPEGREVSVKEIDRWHRARGFAKIGYHYVIHLDGSIDKGRDESEAGAHVSGHNATTIGVCYIGGVDANDINKAKDTRTPAQKVAMEKLVRELLAKYPGAEVLGHRDFPGVAKACPSFDARKWWAEVKDKAPAAAPVKEEPGDREGFVKAIRGDSLSRIARDYSMTLAEIRKLNPGVDGLEVGQLVRIA